MCRRKAALDAFNENAYDQMRYCLKKIIFPWGCDLPRFSILFFIKKLKLCLNWMRSRHKHLPKYFGYAR